MRANIKPLWKYPMALLVVTPITIANAIFAAVHGLITGASIWPTESLLTHSIAVTLSGIKLAKDAKCAPLAIPLNSSTTNGRGASVERYARPFDFSGVRIATIGCEVSRWHREETYCSNTLGWDRVRTLV